MARLDAERRLRAADMLLLYPPYEVRTGDTMV